MPGEVTLAHQVGKEFMPVTGGSQLAYVLLEAKPTEMMAQVRMPLNFAIVLDHSGSMKGAKLKNVKEAVKMVIDRLEPTDYVSVVIFDDTAQVIIPSMPANDKPGMKAAIDQIRDAGGTTMSLGMIQGLNELRRWNIPHAINRMLLLTDGVTYGDAQRCRQLASDAAAVGIGIYTLGIGSDWDEDLLDVVGQMSASGQPAEFIRDPSDALNIFQQQVQSAVNVALRNATLILRLPVGVTPKKAVSVLPIIKDLGQNVLSDRQIIIPLGDLEKDTPQSVLIELMLDPRPEGLFRIGQAELTYDVPIAGLVGESIREDIKVNFTPDTNKTATVNPTVMNFAEKANAHRLVTRVLDEYKRTGKATTRLTPNVTRVLDEETQAALEQINQGQQITQDQVKSIGNKTRKLTQRLDDILP
jgi:Ca-activated chloride channel homolog